MSNHTPGRLQLWTSNSWRRFGVEGGGPVCEPITQSSDGHPDLRFPNGGPGGPDARRFLACWNALLPHKTEDLEREGPLGFRSHARLFEERDELIEALRKTRELINKENGAHYATATETIDAALAKYPKVPG